MSQDLGYNTETKVETFYAHSVVTADSGKSVLVTSNGTYDSKHVIARFIGHSSIWNDGQYIEADSMHYNKLTGYGHAIGNVISIDTAHHSKLKCEYAVYFRQQRVLWAMIKPVMEQVNGKDTIYMRADTFYTAPMVKIQNLKSKTQNPKPSIADSNFKMQDDSIATSKIVADTSTNRKNKHKVASQFKGDIVAKADTLLSKAPNAKNTKPDADFKWVLPKYKYRVPDFIRDTGYAKPIRIADNEPTKQPPTITSEKKARKGKIKTPKIITADTAAADTTAPMYFVGYNHVLIFSDSMQGKCDSVCYTRSDSTIRMISTPILWAHNSQITGDTILLYMDSSELRKMYVPNNALLVSQSGPEKAKIFDQVQGKTLTGFFKANTITNMIVYPNVECIYYATDKDKAYIGVDDATSTRMRIFFADQKITFIKFAQDVHHTITPMEKADFPNMKLSRFKWLTDLRPKTKEELFK